MKSKKLFLLLTITALALINYSCSDDDESSGGSDIGDATITVSGDVQEQKSGMADFHHLTDLPGGMETWEISIHDFSPQTFSLQFMLTSATSEITQPGVGTYEIGFTPNSTSVFTAIYTHIPDGDFMNSTEYSTLWGGTGTLNITTSNDNTVSGNFQFSASKVDDELNIVGTIEVSGEFTANKRQF